MADVVITEFMDDDAVASLSSQFATVYDPTLVDDRVRLLGMLDSVRGLVVRNRTQVDAELLDAAPSLVVVGRLGVGLDNIDLAACADREVAVKPAIGANVTAVAEYVILTALALTRHVFDATTGVLDGSWPRTETVGREVKERRLGLVGLGAIGRAVADRAVALSMNVIAFDPYLDPGDPAWEGVSRVSFDELVTTSDVVSIHVPLTDSTRNLFDRTTIAAMRSGSILINTARGGIVDEDALAQALLSGHLGGAALDVFATEPVTRASRGRLADAPNLIATPHIAGITIESNARVGMMTADHVRRVLAEERR